MKSAFRQPIMPGIQSSRRWVRGELARVTKNQKASSSADPWRASKSLSALGKAFRPCRRRSWPRGSFSAPWPSLPVRWMMSMAQT